MNDRKPILCLDFDGVIHSYSSGWKGADVIPDPPVDGALRFICVAIRKFRVCIFSSRSNQNGGTAAMQNWLRENIDWYCKSNDISTDEVLGQIEWPLEKPAAMVTIDDRALTFTGEWPTIDELLAFQPWNKKPLGATGEFPHGKINDDDQGAIRLGVAYDKLDGIVRIEFGKPIAWLGLPPPQAIEFARVVLKHAGAKKIEIEI